MEIVRLFEIPEGGNFRLPGGEFCIKLSSACAGNQSTSLVQDSSGMKFSIPIDAHVMRVKKIPVFYDLEILRLVNHNPEYPMLEYCDGWEDFEGMGISCVGWAFEEGAANSQEWPSRQFRTMAADLDNYQFIGFNSNEFDDCLLFANGINIESTDLLKLIRFEAFGSVNWEDQPRGYSYSLDGLAKANNISPKSGNGALAPVLWQQGKHDEVLAYCAHDVEILRALWNAFTSAPGIIDPNTGERLSLVI